MGNQQEILLSAVWESSADAMRISDSNGFVLNVNDAYCTLTGFKKRAIIGKPFTLVYDKNEQADLQSYYIDFISGEKTTERTHKSITLSCGKQCIIEASYSKIEILGEKYVLAIIRDITEFMNALDARREIEEKHNRIYNMIRLMLNNTTDMVWAKDLNNKYTFTNKAMCENLLNAKDTEEPIGKDDMFFAQRERTKHKNNPEWHTFGEICRDTDSVVLKKKKPEQFDEYGNVKGKFLFLDVHKAPIFDEQGKIVGTVGSARDVTKEKEIEEGLKRSQEELQKSEEKFRNLSEKSPNMIFINKAGRIVYCK